MKNLRKIAALCICLLLVPFSASYGQDGDDPVEDPFSPLVGLVYYLYVKGPARIWTPTFEFESGNALRVIGASHEYGQLNGVWQEARLGAFLSYFWAQVESDEPTTTTTIPDEIPLPSSLSFQPAQTEKTKFLINLWGVSFPAITDFFPSIDQFPRLIIGSGDYLTATGAVYVGIAFEFDSDDAACPSIDPNSVERGLEDKTVENLVIDCRRTLFTDPGTVTITFIPSTGLEVSDIVVKSDTRVEFDLTVRTTATEGFKNITVTYGTPSKSVTSENIFQITLPELPQE